jgi:hypothetical protein
MKRIIKNIHKKSEEQSPVIVVVDKEIKRNEKGERLTKKGLPYKERKPNPKALEALAKYREQKKKLKEDAKLAPVVVVDESESDEDDEFDIEQIEVKKREPKIVEKEVVKEVVKEVPVEKLVEVVKPDMNVVKENEELKKTNKKLEDSFRFNEHLNRISNMARQTTLRF